MTTTAPTDASRSRLGLALNSVGAVVVGFWLVDLYLGSGAAPFVPGVALLAVVAWLVRVLVPGAEAGPRGSAPTSIHGIHGSGGERVRDACALVMVVAGALAVTGTSALSITPAIVAVAAVASDLRHRLAAAAVLAGLGAAIVTVTAVAQQQSGAFLLGVYGGFALGVVVGLSRRQTREALGRERQLFARTLEIEREQERSALLADRARVARDIHDVLAHSLGGLVIQLDAVEALLEAGRTDEAAARVTAARALAAEGLGEARRAVTTLRDPVDEVAVDEAAVADPLATPDAVARLVEAHESLGGSVALEGLGALDGLDPAHRRAVAAVLREALSNARRHAPGETVTIAVSGAGTGILRLSVSNARPGEVPGAHDTGDGHGLVGMRERFAELGDRSSLDAGPAGEAFVVTMRVDER